MDLLRDYSSSSSDEEHTFGPNKPTNEEDHVASPEETTLGHVRLIDSSNEANDLFVREVPHTRGNWAGHVFCQAPSFGRRASASVTAFCSRLQEAGYTGTVLSHSHNLHLSLSRPFFLQESSIESFVNSLQQRLSLERTTQLVVTGEKLLVNDSGTRSFWCWSLSANPSIRRILNHVDEVMQEYKQDTFYESPEFHVSLASLPGNVTNLLKRHSRQEKEKVAHTATEVDGSSGSSDNEDDGNVPAIVTIDHIYITFGTTKHYRIGLKP